MNNLEIQHSEAYLLRSYLQNKDCYVGGIPGCEESIINTVDKGTVKKSTVELDYQNPANLTHIPSKEMVTRWTQAACHLKSSCSIAVRIVDEKEAMTLNKQYRHKNVATNVLSFPFDPPPVPMPIQHLGDLILCQQVIEKEAQEQHKSRYDHWAHLIIHGTLHLQGYDHITEQQAVEMEALEIQLLKQLGISNPYQEVK